MTKLIVANKTVNLSELGNDEVDVSDIDRRGNLRIDKC